ncbi:MULTISPECIES: hypothetical protein [unclassified Acidovorax]|uniref:hypothetical protein n=1 Tax=unclassified Acidovorax TaxID=2684926 RepID=UPI002882E216|nr:MULTISPECIES: hypothetical protein [unclassified Acidovorax]
MYLVIIGWLYVTVLMAVAEANAANGTLLGAIVTFVLYGLLPMGILGYILGTPGRKRALRARQLAEQQAHDRAQADGSAAEGAVEPDASSEAPAAAEPGRVPPVRKEP